MSILKMYNESRVSLSKYIEYREKLIENIKQLNNWNLGIYGESTEGRELYYLSHQAGKDKPTIMIVAGFHGSEPASIAAATLLPYSLEYNDPITPYYRPDEILENLNIVIVPLINPDGFNRYIECYKRNNEPSWKNTCILARFNANMKDLNRDWVYLEEKETRYLHLLINKINPHFISDHHEFLAAKESPPKWAIETEGFMATLTDNPYMLIRDDLVEVSAEIMNETGYSIEKITGWKTKYRHFGGAKRTALPPYVLGSHVPLENIPKLLVETWGVGLHDYLWDERVNVHLTAMYSILYYAVKNAEKLLEIKKRDDPPPYDFEGYVIEGEEADKALNLLQLHGIRIDRNKVYLRNNKWRIITVMLDEEIEYNKILAEKRNGPYTLQRKFKIKVKRF